MLMVSGGYISNMTFILFRFDALQQAFLMY